MTQRPGSLWVQAVDTVFADAGGASINALQQVSAEFLPGQLSVIVGPSGSGKSTLLHALAGIVVPQRGLIRYGVTAVNQLDEGRRDAWRLTHCGLLFQEFRLIDELDALANVLLPAQFRHTKMPGEMRDRACQLLERFDVPRRSVQVAKMSRGEQQRVALARALLLDPPLILADEPTASLDAVNGNLIAAALQTLARSGKTVVTITHDHKLVALADNLLRMQAGRVLPSVQGGSV
jgi:putative ABC transport system ATP-binding protein